MIERCGDRQRKCDGLEKRLLHFFIESSNDAPGRFPPRLWTLPIHMVHQRLGHMHPHQSHRPRIHLLHRNSDRWDVIVCMHVPNTSIDWSWWSLEEGLGLNYLYRSLQTGTCIHPRDMEPDNPVIRPSPISASDPIREHTG